MPSVSFIGCRVENQGGSGSKSTVTVTSTWFWSPTLQVQEILWKWAWRDQRLDGWAWVVTGVKTGSQTQFWLASHYLSGSPAVIDAPLLHGTLFLQTGNLVKLSLERILGFKLVQFKFPSSIFCVFFFRAFSFPGEKSGNEKSVSVVAVKGRVFYFFF